MKQIKAGYYHNTKTNYGQPFSSGTFGCREFRIPGLIRLANGKLFALSDARWSCADNDFGGIDIMYALSADEGKNWTTGFAAMFPDTNGTPGNPNCATTCMDAMAVQSADGVIHIYCSMNPSGIAIGNLFPSCGSGFLTVNGVKRLLLTDDYGAAGQSYSQNPSAWTYFLGDYSNGYAPVHFINGDFAGYCLDEYFNIYDENRCPLMQKQEENDRDIVQNVFYRGSMLHVLNTTYTLHLFTENEGESWNCELCAFLPKYETEAALIASPGNGILTRDNAVILPFYRFMSPEISDSCMMISSNNGKAWHRTPFVPTTSRLTWTGECKPVELPNGKIRLFVRNDLRRICYADYNRLTDSWEPPVILEITVHSSCNFSAIYKNGHILLSFPRGVGDEARTRTHGNLYMFTLDDACKMCLTDVFSITPDAFSYSVLAAVSENKTAILYDTCEKGAVIFDILEFF